MILAMDLIHLIKLWKLDRKYNATRIVTINMSTKETKYIPALGLDWLTPLYDTVVRLTVRESIFKKSLVGQANIQNDFQVLDVGCGTATLTILIKKSFPEVDVRGLDGDQKILEIARKKALKEDVEIQFEKGMSFDLPYADKSFDRVVSSLFFHHLTRENKQKTFNEIRRILKTDGELHIADWGLPNNSLMKFTSCFVQMLDGVKTTSDNFEGHLPELIKEAGFESVEETSKFNTVFGTIRLYKISKH